ncbi:hypothetical protein PanWU01x14_019400 [Parasponia andersonii]|uniref:Uncharacterized protein n=1 Tax=Parasponia andersonii TaxID=3476 RepID=A0A2P5DYC3_PARAD|nr:hypothetical protein PanWU01x14_019400 [Parasponia andersonii]
MPLPREGDLTLGELLKYKSKKGVEALFVGEKMQENKWELISFTIIPRKGHQSRLLLRSRSSHFRLKDKEKL